MRGAYLSLLNIQLVQRYDFLLDVQARTTTFLIGILRGIMDKMSDNLGIVNIILTSGTTRDKHLK